MSDQEKLLTLAQSTVARGMDVPQMRRGRGHWLKIILKALQEAYRMGKEDAHNSR